jgi:hypothetical protein
MGFPKTFFQMTLTSRDSQEPLKTLTDFLPADEMAKIKIPSGHIRRHKDSSYR